MNEMPGESTSPVALDGDEPRRAYHHGDLRNALIEAAATLARENGPEAVVLREVARRTGVSPTAAYRHFADHAALIEAVKHRAFDELTAAMQTELAAIGDADSLAAAQARLRAIGAAYVRFALAEPGLFRLAFDRRDVPPPPYLGQWQNAAYQLLAETIDALAAHGAITPERRRFSEIAVWSAVHGLATLLVNGHLRAMPDDEREASLERLIEMVLRGL